MEVLQSQSANSDYQEEEKEGVLIRDDNQDRSLKRPSSYHTTELAQIQTNPTKNFHHVQVACKLNDSITLGDFFANHSNLIISNDFYNTEGYPLGLIMGIGGFYHYSGNTSILNGPRVMLFLLGRL